MNHLGATLFVVRITQKSMKIVSTLATCIILPFLIHSQAQDPQKVIDKAIKVHGGKKYSKAHYEYDFRKHHYIFEYNQGDYRYERVSHETSIKDVLTNKGLSRWANGKEVKLSDKDIRKYSNSVNSVNYFAFLPYFLNDPAVNKKYIGEATIRSKSYHMIEVTFDKEGGGDDHDDVYVYWINKDNYTVDYLAYSFHVNGGGVRFREAYNRRNVNGIVFQDYVNYRHDKSTDVRELGNLFDKGALTELSKIELKNIKRKKS